MQDYLKRMFLVQSMNSNIIRQLIFLENQKKQALDLSMVQNTIPSQCHSLVNDNSSNRYNKDENTPFVKNSIIFSKEIGNFTTIFLSFF